MIRFFLPAIGVAIGCVASSQVMAIAAMEPYGAGQCLTPAQTVRAAYLQMPQSYGAISSALGSPEWRDRRSDWHCLPNGGGYLRLDFDRNGRAVNLSWSGF